MIQLLLSDLAIEELKAIPSLTGHQLLNKIQQLRTFPESAPQLLLAGYKEYRQLIVRPYRIIYRYLPEKEQVRIYCILHLRRMLPSSEFLKHQVF